MAIYRINVSSETVGCIAARSKDVAVAYAIGKYGAGADVELVATKDALDAVGICILIETSEKELGIGYSNTNRKFRVIS